MMLRTLAGAFAAALIMTIPVEASANVRMILTGTFKLDVPESPYVAGGKTFKFAFGAPNFYSDLFYNNSKYNLTIGGRKVAQGAQQLYFNYDYIPTMPFYLPNRTLDLGLIVGTIATSGTIYKYHDFYYGYSFSPGNYSFDENALFDFNSETYAPYGTSSNLFEGPLRLSVTQSGRGAAGLRAATFGTLGGVPEPGVWAMLIGGFALTGAAMRRRRPAVWALARA